MARYMYQVHIADGFVDDCEELFHRCARYKTLSFEKFAVVWKETNMASIYQGRTLGAEVAELSEEVLQIAKRYMVADTSNFEESVAGLFLVYGLLSLQPYRRFAVLRLVPDDVPAIARIEMVARRERRLDVLYILGSVLTRGPVHCHAENREYGFEQSLRKYLEGCKSIDKLGIRPKGVFYRQNVELDIFREMNHLTKLYEDVKATITDNEGRKDPNLMYHDKDVPSKMDSSLKSIINGIIDDSDNTSAAGGSTCRRELMRALKEKAMRGTIDPIRHLTTVTDRPKEEPGTSKVQSKSSRNLNITESPMKMVTGHASKKGKLTPMFFKTPTRKGKNKKGEISSDSDSDLSDIKLSSDDDEDLNDEEVLQQRVVVDIGDINKLNLNLNEAEENSQEAQVVKEYDVQIDKLPVRLSRSEDKGLEIEIVNAPKRKKGLKKGKNKKSKNKESPEPSLSIIDSTEDVPEQSTSIAEEDVFKKPVTYKLRKPEKRELKKPILKSKFKKMGLEPVANFDEDQ